MSIIYFNKTRQLSTLFVPIAFVLLFIGSVSAKDKNEMIDKNAAPISLFKISDNKYYRTKDILGKKNIIISFFGTWCGPCRTEIPKLQELSNNLNQDDYEFILICVSNIKPPGSSVSFKEKIPSINKFIEKLDVKLKVLFDKYNVVWRKYADLSKGTFPLTVVINKSGKITYHQHGYTDGDEKKLKSHLMSL